MFIYTLLASLLFFSTPSISDDPYYSDVNYCDIYQYCDNPELDPELDEFYLVNGDMTDEPDMFMLLNENWLLDPQYAVSVALHIECSVSMTRESYAYGHDCEGE
jgi:hypothetical protein